jgi:hypothetical protein
MFQLTVSVATLDQLYTLSGHLAELDFLSAPVIEQTVQPAQPAGVVTVSPSPVTSQGSADTEHQPATDRQVNYLNDLASKAGWKLHLFEDAVISLYGLEDYAQLTKQMASDLITRLQNQEFQPQVQI